MTNIIVNSLNAKNCNSFLQLVKHYVYNFDKKIKEKFFITAFLKIFCRCHIAISIISPNIILYRKLNSLFVLL